jgi:hypothetical protein
MNAHHAPILNSADLAKAMTQSARPGPLMPSVFIGGRPQPHQAWANPFMAVPPLSDLAMMVAALSAPAKPAQKNAPLVTLMNIVLDESGSMQNGVGQTIQGYNKQLDVLRPSADEIGCLVTQINFNSQARVIAKDMKAKDIVALGSHNYNPSGGTALFDTVVAAIKQILSHPQAFDDNTSILLSITTDGDDMNSVTWRNRDMTEFKALMKAVHDNERWTVALAGPNTKLREFADLMCVDPENVAAFEPESVKSRQDMSDSSVMAMSSYASLRSTGMKKMDSLYAGTVSGATAQTILKS